MSLFCVLYTHVKQINMRDLYPRIFRDFLTLDKMVATAIKGVKSITDNRLTLLFVHVCNIFN